jgi:hypothetical protein
MANELPIPDDEPPPDPFEAELVAYLDGELDEAAARRVEARLAQDPAARARAAELKKSFAMLDYLPKPEPSGTFTSRTLDKLPAVKTPPSGPTPAVAPRPAGTTSRGGGAVAGASTSVPVALEFDGPAPARTAWLRYAALAAVVCGCAAAGFLATAAVRTHKAPVPQKEAEVPTRVIENLPLYAGADDLAFVAELTKSELFGEDPAVAFDPALKVPRVGEDRPAARHYESLERAFRALPEARRAEIVKLDHDLHALDPPAYDRCFRALEAYAEWLERLPESERRGVFAAATSGLRLGLVRDIRARQWIDALPPSVRGKPEEIKRWREDEAARRERTALVRHHAETLAANKSPWPFDDEGRRKQVVEFANTVFKIDDARKCRLTNDEKNEYNRLLHVAQRDNAWVWYGLFVYELMNHRPYLPEPADAKLLHTETSDLPTDVARRLDRKAAAGVTAGLPVRLKNLSGRWPEFPLEAHRELNQYKPGATAYTQLGPARVQDFKPEIRTFAEKELFPKLSAAEKKELADVEKKWPQYPQRFVALAQKHDLPVPGVTLPFSPKNWEATYAPKPPAPK